MEQRIIEMEKRMAFQEQTIEDLEQAVTDQQKQIEGLQEQLKIVLFRIADEDFVKPQSEEEKPPHY